MKPSPLLLLIPIGFAIGYGAALHRQTPEPQTADTTALSPNKPDPHALRRDYWHQRFLAILDEPSAALRMSAYYAWPQEIPLAEYPLVMEAIYPEGWARYRGDLPLALTMEWTRLGAPRLAQTYQQLVTRYPELWDNFQGVFFNLGLQNAPGAIPAIQSFTDPDIQSRVAQFFINGIEDKDKTLVFPTRLALLGPQKTYANLSNEELDQALATFWADPKNLLQQDVNLSNTFWMSLGKRYGTDCLAKIDFPSNRSPLLNGILATAPTITPELRQAVIEGWWPDYEIEGILNADEANNYLRRLSEIDEITPKLANNPMPQIWQKGLTRDLSNTLLARANMPTHLRSVILNAAAKLYEPHEFVDLLANDKTISPKPGLNALFDNLTEEERILLIETIPQDWFDPTVISTNLYAFTRSKNNAGIAALINRFGNLGPYLSPNQDFAQRLWQLDPELYLSSLATLDLETQGQHLSVIAQRAQDDELPALLDNSTLDQQINVLIDLISTKATLAIEILKSESPDAFDAEQSVRIGNQLAHYDDNQLALNYFQSRQLDNENDQIALLTYCLNREQSVDETLQQTQIAQTSPQHDFVVRAAQAFTNTSADPAQLQSLQQESPDAFVTTLSTAIQTDYDGSLAKKSAKLLTSPALSPAQRSQIHKALYGDYNP